jgi:hypothetical protein
MFVHILLALSKVSVKRFRVDLATPLWVARYLEVPPRAALALALRPEHWPLALWRPEEDCAAPDWPSPDVAVALLAAVNGCNPISYYGAVDDEVRVAAQKDGIELRQMDAEKPPGFRLMSAEEIAEEVFSWAGEEIESWVFLSPKTIAESPIHAAAVALGAVRPAGSAYIPEPQTAAILAILKSRKRRHEE